MNRLTYILLLILCLSSWQSAEAACLPLPHLLSDSLDVADDTLWDYDIDSSKVVRKQGGVLVIGSGSTIRGCNPFGLNRQRLQKYAAVVNEYQDTFPDLKVYFLAIPTAVEFYLPEESQIKAASQRVAIDVLFDALNPQVVRADSYDALKAHVDEPIYSRTDHHWQPLGAFYAAQQLAKAADVPFRGLEAYQRRVIRNFVGTMAKFSGNNAFRQAPEDFVFYEPTQATYKTIYVKYKLDKARKRILSASEPYQDNFFKPYPDGSGAAYSTFMGGDSRLVRVETDVDNGRRVLILKDSFGNALSSFLFYSFEQVHVVDCRYFSLNIIDYVNEHHITDIVFANNIAHTTDDAISMYRKYLVQGRGEEPVEDVVEKKKTTQATKKTKKTSKK